MEYRYFITEDKKKEWKKEKFGDEYEKLLCKPPIQRKVG